MNNLVIPAAGLSSRYPNMKPKWLLTHPDGKLMIEKILESFETISYDRIIITILSKHCELYEADKILNQLFGEKIEVCILPEQTRDPAHTIYETIKTKKLEGLITIKDSDCIVEADFPLNREFICGLEIDEYTQIENLQNKSYIIKCDKDLITDIVEKQIISNLICVGVYCIDVGSFVEAYEKIISSPVTKIENEVFISHILSYLVSKGTIVYFVPANRFVDWGTLSEWRKEQQRCSTYFFDIDGVLLKNTGRYGKINWSNSFEPIEENWKLLKDLSDNGAQIIFTTSRTEEYLEDFKSKLQKMQIKYKQIITNCNHAQRIIINDFAPTNPYPSCDSISIPRNSSLKEYIK